MILTARETAELRRALIDFGCSQIDGGTRIEIGGYHDGKDVQDLNKEQFRIGDDRSLDEVVEDLLDMNQIPSWCTACYRMGRTGEHFMEFAIPGFIKRFCTPNALLTLEEYLNDYASPAVRAKGARLVAEELAKIPDGGAKQQLTARLAQVRAGERDLHF
jgi:2-iminoacetate synthase